MLIVDTSRNRSSRLMFGQQDGRPVHVLQDLQSGRVLIRLDFDPERHRLLWSGPVNQLNEALQSLGIPWKIVPVTPESLDYIGVSGQKESEDKLDRVSWLLGFLFVLAFLGILMGIPKGSSDISDTRLIQELEKIREKVVKPQKMVQVKLERPMVASSTTAKTQTTLKSSFPKGAFGQLMKLGVPGVRLTQGPVSKGPGLGGLEGSGGVQASVYAKGLIAAPLGLGGKIQGAGGVGTKGRGGGQEGYGQLSLVGQTGASVLPGGNGTRLSEAAGLDRDQIQAVIQQNIHDVRFCYEQGLKDNPQLSGRVTVYFVIGGNGVVKRAQVVSSTLQNAQVEACMIEKLKRWTFPLPEGGVDVEVTYPFTLRRVGQG